jgi:MFS family permease
MGIAPLTCHGQFSGLEGKIATMRWRAWRSGPPGALAGGFGHPHVEQHVMNETVPLASAGEASSAAQPWPSPARAWYAVGIFALALTINFLDRGILNLLIEPVKRDLHLTDVQVSYLVGLAFVLFYVILGLPVARLVDSRSRRLIVGTGLLIWSAMSGVCGLAQSFWQLFAGRVGVGVGEACSGPATYSMLSDLFPPAKLPRAISVLNFGFVTGNALASLVGGALIHFVSTLPPVSLPVVGVLRPWQLTFIGVAIPGLVVAALFTTLQEPVRRGRVSSAQSIPVREVVRFLIDNRKAYGPMFLGLAFNSAMFFGIQTWIPAFFTRAYGWTAAQIGVMLGLVLLIVAPVGLICGSLLAERLARRGRADANLLVTLLAFVLLVPAGILFPLMPTPQLSIGMLGVLFFVAMLSPGPQNAALQIITPNQMRGQVTALYLFIFNAIGFGSGATVVAFVTDHIFRDEALIGYSLVTVTAVLGPISAAIIWSGLEPYAANVLRAREWS